MGPSAFVGVTGLAASWVRTHEGRAASIVLRQRPAFAPWSRPAYAAWRAVRPARYFVMADIHPTPSSRSESPLEGGTDGPRQPSSSPLPLPASSSESSSESVFAWLVRFARGSLAVFAKDLRIEVATGEIVTTTTFFAVLVAILASVALTTGAETTTRVAPGALWLAILFASILALGRSWQREREESALLGVLVSPVPRAAIWCGKAAGVFAFVVAVECVLVPLIALLFHVDLPPVAGALAVVVILGTIGVAATGTLFGAMTVRTRARELLLASVVFPLLSPALLSSVAATREVFYAAASGQPVNIAEVRDWLLLLAVFDTVAVVGGMAMFGALVED